MKKFFSVYVLSICIVFNSVGQVKKTPFISKPKTSTTPFNNKKTGDKPPAQNGSSERMVQIETKYGNMIARLYNATPLHRDNFIKLVNAGFYDSLLFH